MVENKKMKVCWISAGVSSFIAGWLERDTIDKFIYIDIEDQHPDSMRFIKDCEKAFGKEIEIISSEYRSVENAIRTAGMIKNSRTQFAVCTNWLKNEFVINGNLNMQNIKLHMFGGLIVMKSTEQKDYLKQCLNSIMNFH